jgi:O-methyltransferase
VTRSVHSDLKVDDALMAMEASACAAHSRGLAHLDRCGQFAIQSDLELGLVQHAGIPLGGDHQSSLRVYERGRYFPRVNMESEGAGSTSASDGPRLRVTEEALRAAHLKEGTDRQIRAVRPQPGAEPLRAAYLELLKLCLCDLAGARTLSVSRTGDTRRPDSQVKCRELEDEEWVLRARGSDWPFSGLTMVGLKRLDDLQACIESVVADRIEGDVIEAGAWRGGASILARATLDSLGAEDRTVWAADSFRGLPAPDRSGFPEDDELDLSQVEFLAIPAEEVRSYFARFGLEAGVELVEGFFDETLPGLRDRRWSVIRLDGDTYEATWVGLESLYPGLSAGGYLIIDDYGLIKECRAAVDDYRREHGITEPIERVDWNGARWRRADEPEPRVTAPRTGGSRRVATPSSARAGNRPRSPIPTERELELERELRELRERLGTLDGSSGHAPR